MRISKWPCIDVNVNLPHRATIIEQYPDARALTDALIKLLTVTALSDDLFDAPMKPDGVGRIYGGQVIAQALMAATQTVGGDRVPHSLHAYFMRAGAEQEPVQFKVERDYDGGSFTNRRVIAIQRGLPILNLACSFHRPEPGLQHQADMPDVPAPETLRSEAELYRDMVDQIPAQFRAHFLRPRPIEYRPVQPRAFINPEKRAPAQSIWFRTSAPIGDDPIMHRAILAYASDSYLLSTATLPHGKSWMKGELMTASLDHALWIHDEVNVDDWLLYTNQSPWSGGGRGMNLGAIYRRDGRLVATAAQEGLMRPVTPADSA